MLLCICTTIVVACIIRSSNKTTEDMEMKLSKMNTNQLRDLAVQLGADRKKLYGTSKQALIILINKLSK